MSPTARDGTNPDESNDTADPMESLSKLEALVGPTIPDTIEDDTFDAVVLDGKSKDIVVPPSR